MATLKRTGLYDLHVELGAKMVPFAGYEMPVQYPDGVMKEHLHTRAAAGLFDVSHMGQVIVRAKTGDIADAALALETLMPIGVLELKPGRQRYGLLTNVGGGVLDDLMLANRDDHFLVVVNAACKDADLAHMSAHLGATCAVEPVLDRALLALQGPAAETALSALVPGVVDLLFMDTGSFASPYGELWISRSGYSGEDGFEISVPDAGAEALARDLLQDVVVAPVGLGARDSLRLEAGLCLYGADLDTTTSPVEADLVWAMQKTRRAGGKRAGGFPGEARIFGDLAEGVARKRVGLRPEGRAPMRAGTELFADPDGNTPIGTITSGGYGPSVEAPIAMGYVGIAHTAPGTQVFGAVRGKLLAARVADLPFRAPTYKR